MSVQTVGVFTPYSTVQPFFGPLPTWLSADDAQRITAYQIYEQLYWNVPDTFKLVQRGSEDKPIYIPNARTIIDTSNRYIANGFGWRVDASVGTPQSQAMAQLAFDALFARERFKSKFASNKRFGLIRGDWLWHVVADPAKAEGKRISVHALDPAMYIPITDDDNVDRVVGCHLIEQIVDENKTRIKRQSYYKGSWLNQNPNDLLVYSETVVLELEKWRDPKVSPVKQLAKLTPLPPQITALPVYHIRNQEEPGNPFGSSKLRGFERIMAAVNQSISDEELALALDGLGVYATDAGAPRDDDGNPTTWKLGPGRVVELPVGTNMNRVNGVGSVSPMQDHLSFLIEQLYEASTSPDIARGSVDVHVAESGVALALKLGPLLSEAGEADQIITDTMNNMLYDLCGWFEAYEGLPLAPTPTGAAASVVATFGDKIPTNRKERQAELELMLAAGVIDADFYRVEMTKLGYNFPDNIAATSLAHQANQAAAADPFAARVNAELGTTTGG